MSKHHIYSLSVENEQADAAGDGRTRLARPNSQVRTGPVKKNIFRVQLITSGIGNHPRSIHTLLCEKSPLKTWSVRGTPYSSITIVD